MISIKLIVTEDDGRRYAETYVRSLENCDRDNPKIKYKIGTGDNTAFDIALGVPANGRANFFAEDLESLEKEKGYYNERRGYGSFYRSTIVVPIRCRKRKELEPGKESDDIGFLCVDTKSTNRLNGNYHVELLAAFADQMYNFMSLMRGKYTVPYNEQKGIENEKCQS